MTLRTSVILLSCIFLSSCQRGSQPSMGIETGRLSDIVKVLASDEFEGRAPGGVGEEKTVAYLIDSFQALGLQPGAGEGRWTQDVPLIHTQIEAYAAIRLATPAGNISLEQAEDIEISTTRPVERVEIDDAEVVFVGFGASAPERDWDDYGDVDLRGKVAIYLVNDPDFAASSDEPVAGVFGNRRMTYYGRWTYKFEEAARRGAIAALVIHETEAAGYGWNVASSSPGENYSIVSETDDAEPVMLRGWLHGDAAARLFDAAGLDLERQRELARRAEFTAFKLEGVRLSADLSVASGPGRTTMPWALPARWSWRVCSPTARPWSAA